jgi:broad specificity phosphatase PhoE
MSVSILYETHSISTDNEAGIATGWLPGQLSERGRALARQLGERRRDDGIACVYTSDLRRAVETADIAFTGTGIPRRKDPRLRECDYGSLNGAPVERIEAQRSRRIDEPFPGGQSYRDVVEATRDLLTDIAVAHEGQRVLIIAHSANRWALQHLLDGIPLEQLVSAEFAWQEGWEFSLPSGPAGRRR